MITMRTNVATNIYQKYSNVGCAPLLLLCAVMRRYYGRICTDIAKTEHYMR